MPLTLLIQIFACYSLKLHAFCDCSKHTYYISPFGLLKMAGIEFLVDPPLPGENRSKEQQGNSPIRG
ncbi:hypothetical protein PVAP13_2KG242358 [Panicum virgatum]|uniref:Uncharacterized protein n=1 Tax=Panicum virgatum TaxID=38727 RepID=A0A8T0W4P3_PANVG|nr:hypothetical protein PVAP13_2KG242358 [Panicum virgatum]